MKQYLETKQVGKTCFACANFHCQDHFTMSFQKSYHHIFGQKERRQISPPLKYFLIELLFRYV